MTGPFFWTEFRGVLLQSETAATEGGLSGLTQAIHGRSYAVPDGARSRKASLGYVLK